MSKAYQFPQDEPNPFAEVNPAQPAVDANPYATGAVPAMTSAAGADAFQETLPPRSGMVLGLSLTSLLGSVLALVAAFFCLPLGVFVLMLSAPTVAMAQHDLRAMKGGAMNSRDRGTVKVALVMAIIASVISTVSLAIPVGLLIWFASD